jgi:hypothetical protein
MRKLLWLWFSTGCLAHAYLLIFAFDWLISEVSGITGYFIGTVVGTSIWLSLWLLEDKEKTNEQPSQEKGNFNTP